MTLHSSSFKLTAPELRNLTEENKRSAKAQIKNDIHIVLDHVYDAYNVGSAFRIADSINAKKVWLGGSNIVTPLDKQVKKSSMHTCELIDCQVIENTSYIFREKGFFIACEKIPSSESGNFKIQDCRNINGVCSKLNVPIYIIMGNESFGISKEVLSQVDTIVEIPMFGVNNSMNVINALTLISYSVLGVL